MSGAASGRSGTLPSAEVVRIFYSFTLAAAFSFFPVEFLRTYSVHRAIQPKIVGGGLPGLRGFSVATIVIGKAFRVILIDGARLASSE